MFWLIQRWSEVLSCLGANTCMQNQEQHLKKSKRSPPKFVLAKANWVVGWTNSEPAPARVQDQHLVLFGQKGPKSDSDWVLLRKHCICKPYPGRPSKAAVHILYQFLVTYSHVNLNIFSQTLKSLLAHYVRLRLMYLGSWCSFTSDLIQTTQLPALACNTTRATARGWIFGVYVDIIWPEVLISKLHFAFQPPGICLVERGKGKGNCCGPARGDGERKKYL